MNSVSKTVAGIPVKIFNSGSGKKGALVLIQEWWGLTDQLEAQAAHIAKNVDCTVLLPDLYEGKSTLDAEEASHMMGNLDFPKAVERIQNVGIYLKEEHEDKCENVAVMGFCMGGALTIAASVLATHKDAPLFACGIPFYGIPPIGLADPKVTKIPMQGHFGVKDSLEGFSDAKSCDALEESWKAAGIKFGMHRYPNVGHAFMNNAPDAIERKKALGQIGGEDGAIHDEEAIAQAWARSFAFLKENGF